MRGQHTSAVVRAGSGESSVDFSSEISVGGGSATGAAIGSDKGGADSVVSADGIDSSTDSVTKKRLLVSASYLW